ncbi:hypothetical protein KIF24_17185 [Micromonospora sp. Llam7]|uniref:hypothetical protein n=1 Tax=Micromonospora tarapacensis TaxID=2835305 RepID=UPI001C831BCD|nr:hypothetical protein [Micromonospora tarapacensis]MBX7267598.1 hypothetical protein [Micromonospora tarapacensis]
MLIAVTSAKGSTGVTTLAVVLAAVWPGDFPNVVEADCAGGDLGAWHWLPDSPGVATLATQSRTGSVTLDAHVTRLPCGVDVVLAPAGRHPATVAVGLLMEASLGLWTKERPTIVDVGRLEPGAPSAAVVEQADVVLVLARGDEGSLLRVADADLPAGRTRLVLVDGSRYTPFEIADRTGLPVAAEVPWDARAADVVAGRRKPGKAWTRRGLPAAVRALASSLATPPTVPTPAVIRSNRGREG